jgi:hypothetical protein
MRWIVCASLLLFVTGCRTEPLCTPGPGCDSEPSAGGGGSGGGGRGGGDDGGLADMSLIPVADLTPLRACRDMLTCGQACLAQVDIIGCVGACAQGGSPVAQQQFAALEQCVFQFCILDASRQEVGQCVTKAIADPNQCKAQLMACQ